MSGTTLNRATTSDLTADLAASGTRTLTITAPFTGQPLHELPLSSAQDVAEAFARARVAQLAWRASSFSHRRAILLKAHDLLLERQDALLDILQTETGKTRGQAFEELFGAAATTRYTALVARSTLSRKRRRAGIPLVMRTSVSFEPKGVVGVITPWNYPIAMASMDIIAALAAGNAVVEKADNQIVLSVLALRRVYLDAGLPEALWAVVAGDAEEVGNAVVDASDYVCFTGSTATGTKVAQRAAATLTGVSLELGGKNPAIVLDDADPAAAARDAVYGCFSSMGQLCVSIERIYVPRSMEAAFTGEFVRRVESLSQGSALDFSTDLGTLTSAAQLARVQSHVDDALAKGATLLAGGRPRPELGPYFYEPTVLTGVTPDMSAYANETFGCVVSIYPVDSEAEAVALANDSEFGLNAAVFGRSKRHAREVAELLAHGSVNINEGYRASFGSADAPMGGMKHSGLGRRNGREGLLRFVEARTVAEATGLLALPRTGREFAKLSGTMMLMLRALKLIRRA